MSQLSRRTKPEPQASQAPPDPLEWNKQTYRALFCDPRLELKASPRAVEVDQCVSPRLTQRTSKLGQMSPDNLISAKPTFVKLDTRMFCCNQEVPEGFYGPKQSQKKAKQLDARAQKVLDFKRLQEQRHEQRQIVP